MQRWLIRDSILRVLGISDLVTQMMKRAENDFNIESDGGKGSV